MTIELFDYQEQALEAERVHRIEHPEETRLVIVLPTGSGKTVTFGARARRFLDSFDGAGQRVLILTHTDELADQAEATVKLMAESSLTEGAFYSVGMVKAGRDDVEADIIIGSVQTLANPERRQRITDVGLVIVDECELAMAPSWMTVLRHFGCMEGNNPCSLHTGWCSPEGEWLECTPECLGNLPHEQKVPALGFTATLERGDGQGLGELWQDVVFSRDISWGVRKGHLVQPIGYRLEIDVPAISTEAGAQDGQLIDSLAPQKIVDKWLELAADRRTVAFMPLVRSADALRDAFRAAGVTAETIHGGMPDHLRRAHQVAYNSGRIQVLCNAMVLTRGWDSPATSCVIIGRPTKSRSLGIQMAGRGLRRVPGIPVEEQDCILIYVQDATTDLFCHADLSDKPLDRKAQGALTAMEDQWDIGKGLEDPEHLWTGQVDAREFDPLVKRSSKVWRTTMHGTPYLPLSKDGNYVFVVGTSVWQRYRVTVGLPGSERQQFRTACRHQNLPDLEFALTLAEQEAEDRGGDLGRLLADRDRAWRKALPSGAVLERARSLGLGAEVDKILSARAGGKAGKVSDLISKMMATRALEPVVEKIKAATGERA